ncbi:DMT family transporter [Alteribacter keqinensis]|uniref:DMT family transporter n=1 Tax=Alteribacter keqinensis TaxID=2483800 RepID=A0A3M7TVN8_9BACI|nr:DMT family transporter [Alteribacter keqinensis]RNA69321.1 DMT family transporter [Alteribacter keqinensis]
MSRGFTYALLFFVMIIWGMNVVAVKFLVEHISPVAMQGGRIFVAGIAAITVLYFRKELRKLTSKEYLLIMIIAVFGQLSHHALLAVGLVNTTASNASLILGLIPITTAVLAVIFLKDRLTFLRLLGIVTGFIGVALVVLQNGDSVIISRGDLLVFVSMVSQAISFIFIKKLTATVSSKQLTAVMLLIGSLLLIGMSMVFEPQGLSTYTNQTAIVRGVFFSSAILATGLGHILYNAAIQNIGAGQTAIFNNLVPFFALIGSFFLLGETIHGYQIFGFLLIVAGVFLGTGYVDTKIRNRHRKKAA